MAVGVNSAPLTAGCDSCGEFARYARDMRCASIGGGKNHESCLVRSVGVYAMPSPWLCDIDASAPHCLSTLWAKAALLANRPYRPLRVRLTRGRRAS